MIGGFQYGVSTKLTMTLTSLASSTTAGWISAAVDNTVDNFVEVIIQCKFKLVAGTPAADQLVYLYVYGSEDGTTFTDGNITGSSGAFTPRAGTNMLVLQSISAAVVGGLTFVGNPLPLSLVFGGAIPRKWGVFLRNTTGLAFSATALDHAVSYTGMKIINQ